MQQENSGNDKDTDHPVLSSVRLLEVASLRTGARWWGRAFLDFSPRPSSHCVSMLAPWGLGGERRDGEG